MTRVPITRQVGARRILLLSLLVVLVGACSLPEDDGPQAIDDDQVPSQLNGVDVETVPTSTPNSTVHPVYLVKTVTSSDGTTERTLASLSSTFPADPTPQTLIDQLLLTRDDILTAVGDDTLANNIPPDVEISWDEDAGEGIGTITLSKEFDVEGENYALAVAQLVYTATELATVDRVRFRVGDNFITVPAGPANEAQLVVSREDYRHFRPTNVD